MLNRSYSLKSIVFALAFELVIGLFLFPRVVHSMDNDLWLVNPIYTAPALLTFCDGVSEIPAKECNALVALYNSTNGANWTDNTNWLSTTTPCTWHFVACGAGHVLHLYLNNNNLSGTIPIELGDLTNLQELFLGGNTLTGGIPAQLGKLLSLQYLDLGHNGLTGGIPIQLGDLINLQTLELGANDLSGVIPPHLGDLSNLQALLLYGNQLTNPIPLELGKLSNLQTLHLLDNQLTGSIPAQLGDLTNLKYLELGFNHLNGNIPPQLGKLNNLQQLIMDHNQLSGKIPPELGDLSSLTNLDLGGGNQLSGDIPSDLLKLANLLTLSIEFNMLTASDPNLLNWLNSKQPNWASSQTVPPLGLQITVQPNGIQFNWTPIAYTSNSGYYEVDYGSNSNGPFNQLGCITADKFASSCTVNNLAPKTVYYFAIRTFTAAHDLQQNALLSDFSVPILATTRPSNDDFANASLINTGFSNFSDIENIAFASLETGDPTATCGGTSTFRTVWYKYMSLATNVLSLNTTDANYDTVLSVWTGKGLGTLSQVGCNDNNAVLSTSALTVNTTPGTTYYIRVSSHNDIHITLKFNAVAVSSTGTSPLRNYFVTTTPTLSWNQVTTATSYTVQVSTSNTFTNVSYSSVVPANIFSVTTDPLADGVYYWHVSANNGATWSTVESFTINTH